MGEAAIANIKFLSDKMNLLKFQIWSSKNRSNPRVPKIVEFKDFSRLLSDIPVLFKAD